MSTKRSAGGAGSLSVEPGADGVVVFRIDRPAAKNALDFATLDALADAAAAIDPDVRVVILTGAAGMFAAGGDLRELASVVTAEDADRFAERGARACRALSEMAVPVLAAVMGGAYGGGAELALACDIRIGDASTVFGFRQARMGVTTAWGTLSALVSLVGAGRASRLLFAADDIGADKACAFGLLDELAADGTSAEEVALGLARTIASVSSGAVREQKRLLRAAVTMPPARVAEERATFVRTWTGADHAEAMRAFAERRPPVFAGA